ncbi:hypothetical protein D8674_013684 [Pyrus ussuriensis x Pyrus communis]|uniref:Uncharacterized protein n=1 Tax=Pyrus ussuriensis x Pyrus communis TaxID=2448454 RepID=A0A5N5GQD9_9ROSA|nr:hypothetical protein D8674_013684 [Pyrus ussuriensis x Pyrus communis]
MTPILHISTSTIRPTNDGDDELNHRSIELTPWDLRLIQVDYIQKGLLFKKSAETEESSSLIDHLKSTLSRTFNFYPLAGRFALTKNDNDNTYSFFIDCNGNGAEFVHAAADGVKVEDILDSVYFADDIVNHLFCMMDAWNYKGITKPLLAVQRVVFHFCKEKVVELKSKANVEMGTIDNNMISSLQAHMAHLWRAVTRARNLNPNQEVRYRIAVGVRQRMEPPLPKEYIGNGALGLIVKCTAGDPATLDLLTGCSPRFNVYGNDFGWGRSVVVQSKTQERKVGKLTVFPGPKEGSINFECCLWPETIRAMAGDAEFMQAMLT